MKWVLLFEVYLIVGLGDIQVFFNQLNKMGLFFFPESC